MHNHTICIAWKNHLAQVCIIFWQERKEMHLVKQMQLKNAFLCMIQSNKMHSLGTGHGFKLEKTQHLEPNEKFSVLQGTFDHRTIFQRRAGNSSSKVLRKCWG